MDSHYDCHADLVLGLRLGSFWFDGLWSGDVGTWFWSSEVDFADGHVFVELD